MKMRMFALKEKNMYQLVFKVKRVVELTFPHQKNDIVELEVEESEEGEYWGWLEFKNNEYRYIYPKRFMVDMCFPYGPQIEEKENKGRRVKLKLTEIGT
jgi:hypothetical protein